jgi:ubiquinone/menaquinone biosynthesis C-methylase UbiE
MPDLGIALHSGAPGAGDRFDLKPRILAVGLLPTIAIAVACSAAIAQQHVESAQHDFHDAQHWATVFESEDRVKWQQPDRVVRALNLKPGQTVVDIGAGTGFFTRRFAKAVGPTGHAIGLDVEQSMVDYMNADAKKRKLRNYQARLAKPDDPGLAPHSVDLIFFCDTLHHINDRPTYLHKLLAALKPGGRVVDVDFKKEPLPVGPPSEHKLSIPLVNAEFHDAGFRLIAKHDFLTYQYFLEFAPKDRNS